MNGPRKTRTDLGTKRRGNYNTVKADQTGKVGKEAVVMTSFWKKYKVEDVMHMDHYEIEDILDAYLQEFEDKQRARKKDWWYPTINMTTLADIRNKRTKVDKAPRIY